MADEKTKFVLDLDATKFIEGAHNAELAIKKVADVDSLKELSEGLLEAGAAVGVLAAAFFAAKESLDLVREAENIKAINAQFQVLAHQAGISGKALKESLESAAGGLIDDTELLRSANKALVQMGSLASELGPIMDLARRQGALFGIETKDAFEQINSAIATGQTRLLRHLGIVIDQKKAYDDYAKSIGVAADELSKEGQQHAILNALKAKSAGLTAKETEELKKVTTTWQQLKVAIEQVKEVAIIFFDKILGPYVAKAVTILKGMVDTVHELAIAFGGSDLQKAEQNMRALTVSIGNAEKQLEYLESRKKAGGTPEFIKRIDEAIEETKARITALKAEAVQAKVVIDAVEKKEEGTGGQSPVVQRNEVDNKKVLENKQKFNQDLAKLRDENAAAELKYADTELQLKLSTAQKKEAIEKENEAAIQKIKQDNVNRSERANLLIVEQNRLKNNKLRALDEDYSRNYDRMLDNMVKHSKTASDGIANAFHAGSLKAKKDLNDFGKLGKATYDSFTSHAKTALMDLGRGSKDANDIMKQLFFGMLADMAEQRGALTLASSIWPPNPVGIAAGSALLVLAGALSAMSGGSSSAGGGGGSYSTASATNPPIAPMTSLDTSSPADQTMVAQRKVVSVTVQGSYFETEQTKIALVDLIRQASDATDFNVKSVGEAG